MIETLKSIGLAVLGAGLTFIATSFWHSKALKRTEDEKALVQKEKLLERVVELENKLAVVSHTVQPLHAVFQAFLVKQLTRHQNIVDRKAEES